MTLESAGVLRSFDSDDWANTDKLLPQTNRYKNVFIVRFVVYLYVAKTKPYYFAIETINENGTSEWTRAQAL